MQIKKTTALVLTVLCVFVLFPTVNTQAQSADVLLVYQTQEEQTVLGDLIAACGKTVASVRADAYTKDLAKEYSALVTTSPIPLGDAEYPVLCVGSAFSSNTEVTFLSVSKVSVGMSYDGYTQPVRYEEEITLISDYTGRSVATLALSMGRSYPFAVIGARQTYVPYYRGDDLSTVALGSVISGYLGKSQQDGVMYVLIDSVHPFSDLTMLCSLADVFYENAIPFIVRIMPGYDNLEYPAFLRYMQTLRYIQSRNGTVVLHEPLVAEYETEREPLAAKMERFTSTLQDNGVKWMDMSLSPYPFTLDDIERIQSGTKNFGVLPFDAVIVSPIPKTEQELVDTVSRLNRKWLSIGDYKRRYTNENFQYNETPIDLDYEYQHKQEQSMVDFFSTANAYLVVIVAGVLTLFSVLLVIGSRLYKRKFYRK